MYFIYILIQLITLFRTPMPMHTPSMPDHLTIYQVITDRKPTFFPTEQFSTRLSPIQVLRCYHSFVSIGAHTGGRDSINFGDASSVVDPLLSGGRNARLAEGIGALTVASF